MASSHPFTSKLLTNDLKWLIPAHNVSENDWVAGDDWNAGNDSLFDTQWVQCSYSVSGSYTPTPRYIFYFLVFFCIGARRITWLATAALGSVMVYSALAAVHAIVHAVAWQAVFWENFNLLSFVLVKGRSPTSVPGITDANDANNTYGLSLPALPNVRDNDVFPVLAIVGTAFLVLIPMQIWSRTMRETRTKAALVLWGILLFLGAICAISSAIRQMHFSLPQLRFCPRQLHDPLPMTNDGTQNRLGLLRDYWNVTVNNYFNAISDYSADAHATTALRSLGNLCMYPCFAFSWPLRDPEDIRVTEGSRSISSHFSSHFSASYCLFVVIYPLIASSALYCLTMAILMLFGRTHRDLDMNSDLTLRPPSTCHDQQHQQQQEKARHGNVFSHVRAEVGAHVDRIKRTWNGHHPSLQPGGGGPGAVSTPVPLWLHVYNIPLVCLRIYFLILYIFVILFSPFALLFFIANVEWTIWSTTAGQESFNHVGQWSTVVATFLMFMAAILPRLRSNHDDSECQCQNRRFSQATTVEPAP